MKCVEISVCAQCVMCVSVFGVFLECIPISFLATHALPGCSSIICWFYSSINKYDRRHTGRRGNGVVASGGILAGAAYSWVKTNQMATDMVCDAIKARRIFNFRQNTWWICASSQSLVGSIVFRLASTIPNMENYLWECFPAHFPKPNLTKKYFWGK